jgi:hypothetical protein
MLHVVAAADANAAAAAAAASASVVDGFVDGVVVVVVVVASQAGMTPADKAWRTERLQIAMEAVCVI